MGENVGTASSLRANTAHAHEIGRVGHAHGRAARANRGSHRGLEIFFGLSAVRLPGRLPLFEQLGNAVDDTS